MNALFIVIIILGVILFVMLCNSNKDQFQAKDSANMDPIDLCYNQQGFCGLGLHACAYLSNDDNSNLPAMSPSQNGCLGCTKNCALEYQVCSSLNPFGGCHDQFIDCQQSC